MRVTPTRSVTPHPRVRAVPARVERCKALARVDEAPRRRSNTPAKGCLLVPARGEAARVLIALPERKLMFVDAEARRAVGLYDERPHRLPPPAAKTRAPQAPELLLDPGRSIDLPRSAQSLRFTP